PERLGEEDQPVLPALALANTDCSLDEIDIRHFHVHELADPEARLKESSGFSGFFPSRSGPNFRSGLTGWPRGPTPRRASPESSPWSGLIRPSPYRERWGWVERRGGYVRGDDLTGKLTRRLGVTCGRTRERGVMWFDPVAVASCRSRLSCGRP